MKASWNTITKAAEVSAQSAYTSFGPRGSRKGPQVHARVRRQTARIVLGIHPKLSRRSCPAQEGVSHSGLIPPDYPHGEAGAEQLAVLPSEKSSVKGEAANSET
jgi:hypothetical protein